MYSFRANLMGPWILGLLWVLPETAIPAEPIYKSVDEAGTITYSSSPESGSVQSQSIPVPPPPSSTQQREAQRIERQLHGTSQGATSDLDLRKQESRYRLKDAEARLQVARGELAQAQVKHDDDWQNLAQGGRHLKEGYFQRVKAAEAEVRQAEEELAKARRDMR